MSYISGNGALKSKIKKKIMFQEGTLESQA